MQNNIDYLVFCYFPIEQKLFDVEVRPMFSSTISSVVRRTVCHVLCGEVRKGKYEMFTNEHFLVVALRVSCLGCLVLSPQYLLWVT